MLQTGRRGLAQPVEQGCFSTAVLKRTKLGVLGVPKGGDIYLTKQHRPSLPGFALQVTTVECAGVRVAGRTAGGQVLASAACRHLRVFSSRVILVQSA